MLLDDEGSDDEDDDVVEVEASEKARLDSSRQNDNRIR
jgi:hypothetical protein